MFNLFYFAQRRDVVEFYLNAASEQRDQERAFYNLKDCQMCMVSMVVAASCCADVVLFVLP